MAEKATTPQHQIPGYQILAKLGSGATATVYKAKQLSLDRIVAIKVLPKKNTNNPEFVRRLYDEGKAAAKLNHNNIVGALDVGHHGDLHYFVMEYVEGKTVYDELMEAVRIDEEDAVKMVLEVARGLNHAHKAGIIHRDVKPQNIMLTKDGVAKLADMGLARVNSEAGVITESSMASGTPCYISPEQIQNDPHIDFRADLYSLGATFYFMVTGQVPFDAPTPAGVIKMHLREPLVPPIKVVPGLSAGVSQIIQVCMAKDRTFRYDSTEDLIADLEALHQGEEPLRALSKLEAADEAAAAKAQEAKRKAGGKHPAGKSGVVGALWKPEDDAPAETPSAKKVEPEEEEEEEEESAAYTATMPAGIQSQPLFWVAVLGWGMALVFFMLWMISSMGK